MDAKVFEIQCHGNNQKMSAVRMQIQVWLWERMLSRCDPGLQGLPTAARECGVGHLQHGPLGANTLAWL